MSQTQQPIPMIERETSNTTDPEYKWELLPDDYTKYDLSFKLIVIGDSGVGKSCLTNKATKNIFEESYNATVGFEFFSFNIRMNGKVLKLQIWDTCGQELYRSLITNFYRNSSLAIMVYSIASKNSFDNIDVWLKELRLHSNPDAKVFLIGNKIDLENEREVTKEQGEAYSQENNLNFFMEASAKTGMNAQKIFIEAAKVLYDDYLKYKVKIDQKEKEKPVDVKPNAPEGQQTKKLEEVKVKDNTTGCAC